MKCAVCHKHVTCNFCSIFKGIPLCAYTHRARVGEFFLYQQLGSVDVLLKRPGTQAGVLNFQDSCRTSLLCFWNTFITDLELLIFPVLEWNHPISELNSEYNRNNYL